MKQIKILIKSILSFFYFLNKKKIIGEMIDNKKYSNLFFGYYDVSPFDKAEGLLVLHGQKNEDELDILIYNIDNKSFKTVGNTNSWNYQQGARLMWYAENEIIYNKYDSTTKKYYSVIVNLLNGKENIIDHPLQALFKNDYLLSISYDYLDEIGTEYGYKLKEDNAEADSLIYVDLKNKNKSNVLFKLKDCLELLNGTYPDSERFHFNHFLISPNGDYFIFIYRFYCNGVRVDHLFGYSTRDKSLEVLIEDELISHCSWRNNKEFIFWGKINNVPGYYLYSLKTKSVHFKLPTPEDGHPTFIDSSTILTDTYPDRFLCQTLSLINIESGIQKTILKIKHPATYSAYERCDLHPSISPSKTKFQIDVSNNGKRKICIGTL